MESRESRAGHSTHSLPEHREDKHGMSMWPVLPVRAALFLAQGLPGCVYKVCEFLLREAGTLEVGLHLGQDPWVVLAFTSASPGKYGQVWIWQSAVSLQPNLVPLVCPGLDASPPASTHELTIPNDVSIPPAPFCPHKDCPRDNSRALPSFATLN